jgi:hypothetical protein
MTDAQSKQSDQAMSNTNELMAELKKVTVKYEQVLKVSAGVTQLRIPFLSRGAGMVHSGKQFSASNFGTCTGFWFER